MNKIIIHARKHDDAKVVSAEFEVETLDPRVLTDALSAEMMRVNAWAENSGSIIGHLKGFIEPCEGAVTLSTTGDAVNVSGSLTFDVGVTGIIMLTELEAVQEQIAELSKNVLAKFGVSDVEIEICGGEHGHHEHHHER